MMCVTQKSTRKPDKIHQKVIIFIEATDKDTENLLTKKTLS